MTEVNKLMNEIVTVVKECKKEGILDGILAICSFSQKLISEDRENRKTDSKRKEDPIAYTVIEGGDWYRWQRKDIGHNGIIYAWLWSDGWVFDQLLGWRKYDTIKLGQIKHHLGIYEDVG